MLCPYWTYVRPQRTMRQLIVIVSAWSVLPGQNLAWSKGLMEDVMFDPSIPCSHSAALPKHPPAKVVTYCTDMVEGVQWLLLKAPKNTEDPVQVNIGHHIIHIIFDFRTTHLYDCQVVHTSSESQLHMHDTADHVCQHTSSSPMQVVGWTLVPARIFDQV